MDQRPRDRRSLLFATTQLVNEVSRSILESDQINQFRRPLFTFTRRDALEEQWETDVLEDIHRRQEIEKLKDKPRAVAPVFRERSVIRSVQGEAIDKDLPGSWIFESGQEMNKSTLAAAARSAHRDKFISRDFQRHTVQRVHSPLASLIMTRDIPERDQGSLIRHGRGSRK